MRKIDPNQVNAYFRKLWEIMSFACALGSVLYVAFGNNASHAFAIALAGVAFFMLSSWSHESTDDHD